jgi:hypothetical protein
MKHTHVLDCITDPRLPAVFRTPRWPRLARNPLRRSRHMGGLADNTARRLEAAAIAQALDMSEPQAEFNAGFIALRDNITYGEAVDTMAAYAASLAAGPKSSAGQCRAADPSEPASPRSALARIGAAISRMRAMVCQSPASAGASSAPRK